MVLHTKSERYSAECLAILQAILQIIAQMLGIWFEPSVQTGTNYSKSALLLLVLGILANDHDAALTLDDLALFADGFYGRSYFHCTASLLHPIDQFLLRQVIRPRVRS